MEGLAVLVVVDMQNGFVSSKSAPVVPRVVDLVDQWADAGGPTLFTRFVNRPGSPYERLIGWSRMQSEPETSIVGELAPAAGRAVAIVEKPAYTLFTPTGAAAVDRGAESADGMRRVRAWSDSVDRD